MSSCRLYSPVLALILGASMAWAFGAPYGPLFTPPEAPFINAPDEQVVPVNVGNVPVSELQSELDAARREHPEAIIHARVRGTVTVESAPLKLPSKTCLEFLEGGGIRVAPGAEPTALVLVESAEFVSVFCHSLDRPILDGGGVAVGIKVVDSGKVNLDNLLLTGCATGIRYDGRGRDVFCDAGSITRCRMEACTEAGATVANAAQFVCLDNEFLRNGRCGLSIDSLDCSVAANQFAANGTGIEVLSEDGTVTGNRFRGNEPAIDLRPEAKLNLVTYNRLDANALGMKVAGEQNSIYCNEMANEREFEIGGAGNVIAGHRDVKPEEATCEGSVYFNPPTLGNDHDDAVIVNGMGRFDLEVQGGADSSFHRREFRAEEDRCEPALLSTVQKALDEARAAHPDDVVVAHLKGLFLGDGEGTGLAVPENTCVVLNGEIRSDSDGLDYRKSPKGRDTQLILMAEKGFASFSGGIVDANFQPYHAINAPGKNIAIIDGVTVKRAGFNGITTKYHGRPGMPMFIRACTVVDCANRGIWIHVCKDVHAIDNVSSGNISDGIDLDAYANNCSALFNTCTANQRHGVFVEEGVKHDLVLGNVLNGNYSMGIWVWNQAVEGNTGPNAMVANVCRGNTSGLGAGGRSAEKSAHGNFFFNNSAIDNRGAGLRYGNVNSTGSYFTQSVTRGNVEDVVNWTREPIRLFFADPQ